MKTIALRFAQPFAKSNLINAISWMMLGVVATYLTTTTAEAQVSGQAFCSLFTNSFKGYHQMAAVGHCGWCYAAAASFVASAVSLFKKA